MDNVVLTEVDVVCSAVRKTFSVITSVLFTKFPVCDIEALLQSLLCVLRPNLYCPDVDACCSSNGL